MSEAILHIEGMTCKGCVQTVERAILDLNGIERALVDLEKGNAFVQYDSNVVTEQKIKEAIQNSGYHI
ncbi:cation transporter [Cytobacillus sp. S13-E01]|uniref:heavy-metal-associated domain-containing protein n=1 Tax=Cytobacillus sp. S13-E01 TaxID=3031326 RepID=UPI0023D89BE0|nr:cation transporter [Cytobacillus sp. S13-E01]MDF0725650.1 cation transporter [Cytobacillus sp. S13-E01]